MKLAQDCRKGFYHYQRGFKDDSGVRGTGLFLSCCRYNDNIEMNSFTNELILIINDNDKEHLIEVSSHVYNQLHRIKLLL